MSAGRVGRPHGRDGSFWVEGATHELPAGLSLTLADRAYVIERRDGSGERPLLRLSGLENPAPLRGEPLLVEDELAASEYLSGELEGCSVRGLGEVRRVLDGPSCSLLELEDGSLIPLVSDAIRSIDVRRRVIEVEEGYVA